MSRLVVSLVCLLVVAPTVLGGVGGVEASSTDASHSRNGDRVDAAAITAVYPNPVARDDRGEYVVVTIPDARGNWSLSDGEATVHIPADDAGSRVIVAADPTALTNGTSAATSAIDAATSTTNTKNAKKVTNTTTSDTNERIVVAPDDFALSNAGERLRLSCDGRVVDSVSYRNAPEGERWLPNVRQFWDESDGSGNGTWRPLGYEPRPVTTAGPTNATAFVLPDDPEVPVATLHEADHRILLAGYTFASDRAAHALLAAARRGVDVRVLVDDAPVGGMSRREATVLDSLTRGGVAVRVIGGDRARYSYHHPKYAVVDDRALVMTENWKPAGTGGHSSRGWGVRLDGAATGDQLADVFSGDFGGRDTRSWSAFRRGHGFEPPHPSNATYPSEFRPRRVHVERVRLLTAPGNAERSVVGIVDNATTRVDVIQPTVGSRHQPFLRACVRAAERGVHVRVLLSPAWYDEKQNHALVDWLNRIATERDLPLTARVADPGDRYEKIHAKGLVADDTVVVGSLNWNNHSARENREVDVALDGGSAATYYERVFEADWRGGSSGGAGGVSGADGDVPRTLAVALVALVVAVVAYAVRSLAFADGEWNG